MKGNVRKLIKDFHENKKPNTFNDLSLFWLESMNEKPVALVE